MQIIGMGDICEFTPFFRCANLSANLREKNILFEFDTHMIKTAKQLGISHFSLSVADEIEAVLSNAAGAKYIFASKDNLKKFAMLAQNYMFDSKIAFLCKNREDFEFAIQNCADAAVFSKGVIDE